MIRTALDFCKPSQEPGQGSSPLLDEIVLEASDGSLRRKRRQEDAFQTAGQRIIPCHITSHGIASHHVFHKRIFLVPYQEREGRRNRRWILEEDVVEPEEIGIPTMDHVCGRDIRIFRDHCVGDVSEDPREEQGRMGRSIMVSEGRMLGRKEETHSPFPTFAHLRDSTNAHFQSLSRLPEFPCVRCWVEGSDGVNHHTTHIYTHTHTDRNRLWTDFWICCLRLLSSASRIPLGISEPWESLSSSESSVTERRTQSERRRDRVRVRQPNLHTPIGLGLHTSHTLRALALLLEKALEECTAAPETRPTERVVRVCSHGGGKDQGDRELHHSVRGWTAFQCPVKLRDPAGRTDRDLFRLLEGFLADSTPPKPQDTKIP